MVDAHTAGINFFLQTTKTLPVEYKILGTTPQIQDISLAVRFVRLVRIFSGCVQPAALQSLYVEGAN